MKKIIMGAALAASLLTTQAMASEVKNGGFIGLEIGSTSYDLKAENLTVPGNTASESDSGGSQSIKLGKYLGKVGRVYGGIGRVNVDGADILTYGVGYDYLFYNSSAFVPFIGATVGYQQVDIDNSSIDLSGVTYGAEIGVQYAINKKFDIELGYRMNFDSNSDTTVVLAQSIELSIEDTRIWYIGANYNF